MINKKLVAAFLTSVMAISLCACSGNTSGPASDNDKAEGKKEYDKVVYAYATFNNVPDSKTLDTVEEEVNKITREKIGVEVELMPIGIADYSSSVSLSLQGGDKIDIFESLGNYNVCVSSNMAYDITNLIDEHAAETKELVGEKFLNACKKDGKLFGIPTYKPYALTPMIIYRQDIADELGIDMTQVKSIYELTDVLKKVKEKHPTMTPLIPCQTGDSGMGRCIEEVDYLTDDLFSPKGVLMGGEMKVQDLYSSDEFSKLCDLTRSWYQDGLILKDAATTTSTATELMASGNGFCYIAAYSYPPEDTAASLVGQCGNVALGAVQIGDAYLATDTINAVSWMISSTTDVPEAALKFLNLTYTDKDVLNTILYGVKGRDYVVNEEGYANYPEGQDAATVPYTAQLSSGTMGNFFLMYPLVGTKKESLVWEEEQNEKAAVSPAMGFTFDSSSVKTEYTAISNVIKQYLPGLSCGSVDPKTALPEFVNKLNSAGYNKILEEKQKQLDTWLSENK